MAVRISCLEDAKILMQEIFGITEHDAARVPKSLEGVRKTDTDFSFRQNIAIQFNKNTSISRKDIFDSLDDKYRPLYLPEDAETMFMGYVGHRYSTGGCVPLAINPGGGGDAYSERTPEDKMFFPVLEALKFAETSEDVENMFERFTLTFPPIVRQWNLWRIFRPTIEAADVTLDEVAYVNAVPYRTRGDKTPPVSAQREAWRLVTEPLLNVLTSGVIIALGKKAGRI